MKIPTIHLASPVFLRDESSCKNRTFCSIAGQQSSLSECRRLRTERANPRTTGRAVRSDSATTWALSAQAQRRADQKESRQQRSWPLLVSFDGAIGNSERR